jgi:hypothetical protein
MKEYNAANQLQNTELQPMLNGDSLTLLKIK